MAIRRGWEVERDDWKKDHRILAFLDFRSPSVRLTCHSALICRPSWPISKFYFCLASHFQTFKCIHDPPHIQFRTCAIIDHGDHTYLVLFMAYPHPRAASPTVRSTLWRGVFGLHIHPS